MKKTVVDNGSYYTFPREPAWVTMRPGIYYPGWSQQDGFLLVQNKVKEEELEKELDHPKRLQEETDQSPEIPDLPKNGQNAEAYIPTEPFVSDNYFPMEEYSPGLRKVEEGIQFFLHRRDFFEDNGLDYKRSVLFFGKPGTGKTWYIRNLTERLVEQHDAIIIRIDTQENLEHLHRGLNDVNRALEGRMKVIVMEELAEFCRESHLRTKALQLLDSTYFRSNVLFMVTTNEPDTIPKNLIDRPSRLDVLAKVDGTDNDEGFVPAWYEHITGEQFPEEEVCKEWYKDAVGQLTPVYWAELFKYSALHGQNLEESWWEIKDRKELIKQHFSEHDPVGFNH